VAEPATTGAKPRDFDALLERIENPSLEGIEAQDVGLVGRTLAFEPLHRLLPAAIAVRAALAAGRLAFRVPRLRRSSIDRVRPLLSPEADEAEIERYARVQLGERLAYFEIFWRPWLVPGMRIEGYDHLRAAEEEGKGVLIATTHIGPNWTLYIGLGKRGHDLYCLGYRGFEPVIARGPLAPYGVERGRRLIEAGCKVIPTGDSYWFMRELLRRGKTGLLATTFPSTSGKGPVTPLLGHRVRLATGAASLAFETGARVVYGNTLREGSKPVIHIAPPVRPEDFSDRDQLHRHLAGMADEFMSAHREQIYSGFFPILAAMRAQVGDG
jgi:lauroyl/myristoyl acyltransferase